MDKVARVVEIRRYVHEKKVLLDLSGDKMTEIDIKKRKIHIKSS